MLKFLRRLFGLLITLGLIVAVLWLLFRLLAPEGATVQDLLTGLESVARLGSRQVEGPVLPLGQGGDGLEPDLLALTRQLGPAPLDLFSGDKAVELSGTPFLITYLEMHEDQRQVRWEYEIGEESTGLFPLEAVYDTQAVYVMTGQRLLKLNRADGTLAWQTQLSDQIPNSCHHCLARIGERVVILTADRMLHGVETGDGQPAWQIRLNQAQAPPDMGFAVMGEQLVVVDALAESETQNTIFVYNPDDGQPLRQMTPRCGDEKVVQARGLRFSDTILFDRDGGRVDLVMAGGPEVVCVQRWMVSDGQLTVDLVLPAASLPPLAALRVQPGLSNLPIAYFGAQTLYLAGEGSLTTVELGSGQIRPLLAEPDYLLVPVQQLTDRILVLARRSRGTETYELWAVDPAAGQIGWRFQIRSRGGPFLNPAGIPADWLFRYTPHGLTIVQLLAEGSRDYAQADILDPRTGQVWRSERSEISDAFLTGQAWTRDAAYLTLRNLHRVDLNSGRVVWEWPPFIRAETP